MNKPVARAANATSASSAQDVDRLLGAPRLVEAEDGNAYDALLSRVRDAVQPTDIIKEFWVRDVADLRELDRHCAAVAQRLREAAEAEVEAHFTFVGSPAALPKP
jgi:hypothetical protein